MMKIVLLSLLVAVALANEGEQESKGCYYYCYYDNAEPYCCGTVEQGSEYLSKKSDAEDSPDIMTNDNRISGRHKRSPNDKDSNVVYSVSSSSSSKRNNKVRSLASLLSKKQERDKDEVIENIDKKQKKETPSDNTEILLEYLNNPEPSNVKTRSTSDESTLYREDVDKVLEEKEAPLEKDIYSQLLEESTEQSFKPKRSSPYDTYVEEEIAYEKPVRYIKETIQPYPFLVPLPQKEDKSWWKYFSDMFDETFKKEKKEEYLLVYPPYSPPYSPEYTPQYAPSYKKYPPIIGSHEEYVVPDYQVPLDHPHFKQPPSVIQKYEETFIPNKVYPSLHPVHTHSSEEAVAPNVLEDLTLQLQDLLCPCSDVSSEAELCPCEMKDMHVVFPPEPHSPYLILKAPHLKKPTVDKPHIEKEGPPVYSPKTNSNDQSHKYPVMKIPKEYQNHMISMALSNFASPPKFNIHNSIPVAPTKPVIRQQPIIQSFQRPNFQHLPSQQVDHTQSVPPSHGFTLEPHQLQAMLTSLMSQQQGPPQTQQIISSPNIVQQPQVAPLPTFNAQQGIPLVQQPQQLPIFQQQALPHIFLQNSDHLQGSQRLPGINIRPHQFQPTETFSLEELNQAPTSDDSDDSGFSLIPASVSEFFSSLPSPIDMFDFSSEDDESSFSSSPLAFSDSLGFQSLSAITDAIESNRGFEFSDRKDDVGDTKVKKDVGSKLTPNEFEVLKSILKKHEKERPKRSIDVKDSLLIRSLKR